MSVKITEHHLSRAAYIYVRQSTLGQVRFHRESTERQYALRDRALELGWAPETIQILDRDLGVSGTQMTGREDFKRLVADVSLGQVGAVFALEVSRFARSNLDWHRLIELCALMGTLVIDADGSYDPSDFNDGLLLGLKGTMAQAELHFLRARLLGGKLNKAQKGELRSPLPVGLCYNDEQTIIDPDQEVQGAVRSLFAFFEQTGTAYGVVHRFAKLNLSFPKRAYGGVWDGQLIWGRLSESRVLGVLKNPRYAGAYVYGRYQSQRKVATDGSIETHSQPMPLDQWRVLLQDHHAGYITWDEYLRNQTRLSHNCTRGGASLLSGPVREGLTLLQGLLICGSCGRKLSIRYRGNGGLYPTYECNWMRREGLATRSCMAIRADLLDTAMTEQLFEFLKPAQLKLAVEALKHLEAREQHITKQWEMRLDRATYEAQLAERRYNESDPSNRLVASTLESRWNDALERLEQLKLQCAESHHQQAHVATPEQKEKVLALARDFPRLWKAQTTQAKDRKRMLRLVLKDITVERPHGEKRAVLHVRWQGGACADVEVIIPANIADRMRYPTEQVDRIHDLAKAYCDEDIAAQLNDTGVRSPTGKTFTTSMIQWVRYRYKIPKPQLQRTGEVTVKELAQRFGVSSHVVYYWIEHGVLEARRLKPGTRYWITLSDAKERELRRWVNNSSRIDGHEHSEQPL